MAAPYHNLGSKLDRALVAYLIGQGAGTARDVLPSNHSGTREVPFTVVSAHRGTPNPAAMGTYDVDVRVQIEGLAGNQPGRGSRHQNRLLFDARVAKTYDALHLSTDGVSLLATADAITAAGRALAVSDPDNDADMVDFGCLYMTDLGFDRGEPKDEPGTFLEILNLRCRCCPSAVD